MLLKRTTILYFVLPAIGLGALAFALLQWPLEELGNADPYSEFPSLGGILIYIVGVFVGGALLFTALVLALFQTERGRHWEWFGSLLAVSILSSILSTIVGVYFPLAFLILALTVAAYGLLGPSTSSQ
jgi:hypothetical protein